MAYYADTPTSTELQTALLFSPCNVPKYEKRYEYRYEVNYHLSKRSWVVETQYIDCSHKVVVFVSLGTTPAQRFTRCIFYDRCTSVARSKGQLPIHENEPSSGEMSTGRKQWALMVLQVGTSSPECHRLPRLIKNIPLLIFLLATCPAFSFSCSALYAGRRYQEYPAGNSL
jgi:hypothetical protein